MDGGRHGGSRRIGAGSCCNRASCAALELHPVPSFTECICRKSITESSMACIHLLPSLHARPHLRCVGRDDTDVPWAHIPCPQQGSHAARSRSRLCSIGLGASRRHRLQSVRKGRRQGLGALAVQQMKQPQPVKHPQSVARAGVSSGMQRGLCWLLFHLTSLPLVTSTNMSGPCAGAGQGRPRGAGL